MIADTPELALEAPEQPARDLKLAVLRFTVFGHSQPAGSKKAVALKQGGRYTGRVNVIDDNAKTKGWQAHVGEAAHDAMDGLPLFRGALSLTLRFYRSRPSGHYGRSGRVLPSAPMFPVTRPDSIKLTRAIEDALTSVVWADDAQIVEHRILKLYDAPERVEIEIGELR